MEVTQLSADGLVKRFAVTFPSENIATELDTRLRNRAKTQRIKGFRPGKAPPSVVRQRFAKFELHALVESLFTRGRDQIVDENSLNLAMPARMVAPRVRDGEIDGSIVQGLLNDGDDLRIEIEFESLPELGSFMFNDIELERPVAKISETEVANTLEELREQARPYAPREAVQVAQAGDQLEAVVDIQVRGRIDLRRRNENVRLAVGDSEDDAVAKALVGIATGEKRSVSLTDDAFIERFNFTQEMLESLPQGQKDQSNAVIVTAKQVFRPLDLPDDAELARGLGVASVEELRTNCRTRLQAELDAIASGILRRRLLDQLDRKFQFAVPPSLEEQEFANIASQLAPSARRAADGARSGAPQAHHPFDDPETQDDYRAIANRRVRLGLLLAEVSKSNKITVPDAEIQRELIRRAKRHRGQEMSYYEHFRRDPNTYAAIQAPLLEEKTLEFICKSCSIKEVSYSPEELRALDRDYDEIDGSTSPNEGSHLSDDNP